MATGDVVFQSVNCPALDGGTSHHQESGTKMLVQICRFGPGTSLVPASGAYIDERLTVRLRRSPGDPEPGPLFEKGKLYKITIEEM